MTTSISSIFCQTFEKKNLDFFMIFWLLINYVYTSIVHIIITFILSFEFLYYCIVNVYVYVQYMYREKWRGASSFFFTIGLSAFLFLARNK